MAALDELRFGAQRTLNLRDALPTAAEAVRRAEVWLRELQVKGAKEALIITGRGNQSIGGIPVVKLAIDKLLYSLHRRGVVGSHAEHNPGAFAVTLAPLRSLAEAAPRRRDPLAHTPAGPSLRFHGLSQETLVLLRDLAERSLDTIGVDPDGARVTDEMHRYLRVLSPGLPGGDGMESALRSALRAALAEHD